MTSLSEIAPTPVWMTLTPTSGWSIFPSSPTTASTEPWTSPLTMRLSSRTAPSSDLREELLEGDALLRAPGELLGAQALAAQAWRGAAPGARSRRRGRARRRRGGLSKPRISTGVPGAASFTFSPTVVVERAHLAPSVAGDDRVADPESAAADEHGRDRAAPDVEAALDDRPGGLRLRIRRQLELGVGDEEDLFHEVVQTLAGLRRDVGELCRPAPLLRLEAVRTRAPGARAAGSRRPCRSCSRRRRSAPRPPARG